MQKQVSPKAQSVVVQEREPNALDTIDISISVSIRTNVRANLDASQWTDAIRQVLRANKK